MHGDAVGEAMKKLEKWERFVLILTLLFVLSTMGYFFWDQHSRQDISLAVERLDTYEFSAPPEEPPAAGILPNERINVNTAPVGDLMRLPGIGEVKAAAIVSYREEHGDFVQPDDLVLVHGIGEKTLESLLPYITVGDEPAAAAAEEDERKEGDYGEATGGG